MNVTAIRQALANKLGATFTPADDDGISWTVSPRILTQPDVPCMVVMKGPTTYGEAMGLATLDLLQMVVVAYVSIGASDDSQDLLDELLASSGDRSVYGCLMAPDHNSQVQLGGACGDLTVKEDSGHRLYEIGGVMYLGADWTMEVYA